MSSISNVGGYNASAMYASMKMQRPDPSKMAEKLFSQLDTKGQGYIEKSDLESAFSKTSSRSTSTSGASVDDVFTQLDGDSDGKVSQQEFADSLKKLSEALGSAGGPGGASGPGGMGGMPPPPPPDGADTAGGLSKDQLTNMAKEIGSTDSKQSELMNQLVENFDQADTNGDGKVSRDEAMSFNKSNRDQSGSDSSSAATANTQEISQQVMHRIMQLMHTYNTGSSTDQSNNTSQVSVSA